MQERDQALIPCPVTAPNQPRYFERPFLGIASGVGTESSEWVGFYAGGVTEGPENFVIYYRSPKEKNAFQPVCVIDPPGLVRAFDSVPWVDPQGRLWIFWAQSYEWNDGRCGVFCSRCDEPDAAVPRFTPSRRIADGIMMNKPTVLRDGSWLLPITVWNCTHSEKWGDLPEEDRKAFVYRGRDGGESFERLGGVSVPNRCFDEHMVVERNDGSLRMYVRLYDGIGTSDSTDGGLHWTTGEKTLGGANSRAFFRRLRTGEIVQVNHVPDSLPEGDLKTHWIIRNNLTASLSLDDGETWPYSLLLDERAGVSYPDGWEDGQGRITIVYDRGRTDEREILLARFTREDILAGNTAPENLKQVIIKG